MHWDRDRVRTSWPGYAVCEERGERKMVRESVHGAVWRCVIATALAVVGIGADAALAQPSLAEGGRQERDDVPNLEGVLEAVQELVGRIERRLDEMASHPRLQSVQVQTGKVALPYSNPGPRRPVIPDGAGFGEGLYRGVVDGRVNFPEPFVNAPVVHLALSGLDVYGVANTRIQTVVTDVDERGFGWEIWSWADTHVYRAEAVWIAVAK